MARMEKNFWDCPACASRFDITCEMDDEHGHPVVEGFERYVECPACGASLRRGLDLWTDQGNP